MLKYTIVKLNDLVKAFSENENFVKNILATFSCENNKDVDRFLKEKAVLFDRQGWSKTHLVFTSYKTEMVLVGYFTLAPKSFVIIKNNRKSGADKIGKTLMKRIAKHARYDREMNQYTTSAPLIGQLGKNDKYSNLISGDVLLKYACDTVQVAQSYIGGRFVYLECEDKPKLLDFYSTNGFVSFGRRNLEADESDINGNYLIQMLKYLK